MKVSLIILLFVAAICSAVCAEIKTEADFLAAIKTALAEKNADKIEALEYTSGMSDADKAMGSRSLKPIFLMQGQLDSITAESLPAAFNNSYVLNGKRYDPTYKPLGVIKVGYKQNNGSASFDFPYAVIDGTYYIVATKSTDLGWKGPPDAQIGFLITGTGSEKAVVKAKYNASGVDQSETFETSSSILMGQYFSEITVTSDDPAANITLTVTENGKAIFTSTPLKGKGEIKYLKKSD